MSYGKKVDRTHGAIRDGLRKVGVVVFDTSGSAHTKGGRGGPDLLCYLRGWGWQPLWVKQPGGTLTESEHRLKRDGVALVFVETLSGALNVFGLASKEPKAVGAVREDSR